MTTAAEPIVDITQGKLKAATDGAVLVFRGVPYGASTAGPRRTGVIAPKTYNCLEQRRHEFDSVGAELADAAWTKAESIRTQLRHSLLRPAGALYFPLADFLGKPFVTAAPEEVVAVTGRQIFDELEEDVAKLAARIYAPDAKEFAAIEHAVLIAGGARKAFAIRHLLKSELKTQSNPWQHSLVTDYWTALDLVNVSRKMDRG